jgi:tetratricopeptide (TPR) repeat protein
MRFLFAVMLLISSQVFAQDVDVILKEAQNLERSLKENEAFDKYKQVVGVDPNNMQALVRCAELLAAIGGRQEDKKAKAASFNMAKDYADKALAVDANSADANYVRALAAHKLIDVETENKKVVANIKDVRTYVDKALSINPNHAKANYLLGKWHFDMVSIQWAKKAALKVLFGGIPTATIEDAEKYMEKARTLEQYFVLDNLELAKAYKFDNKPEKAIEVLNKLVKLPIRTADDAALKAEGKKMLSEMQ